MMIGAVIVTMVGCVRFLIGQKMVERGKCRGGGFDLVGVGSWFGIVRLVIFLLTQVMSADKVEG